MGVSEEQAERFGLPYGDETRYFIQALQVDPSTEDVVGKTPLRVLGAPDSFTNSVISPRELIFGVDNKLSAKNDNPNILYAGTAPRSIKKIPGEQGAGNAIKQLKTSSLAETRPPVFGRKSDPNIPITSIIGPVLTRPPGQGQYSPGMVTVQDLIGGYRDYQRAWYDDDADPVLMDLHELNDRLAQAYDVDREQARDINYARRNGISLVRQFQRLPEEKRPKGQSQYTKHFVETLQDLFALARDNSSASNTRAAPYLVAAPESALMGNFVPETGNFKSYGNVYFPASVTPLKRINIADYHRNLPWSMSEEDLLGALHAIDRTTDPKARKRLLRALDDAMDPLWYANAGFTQPDDLTVQFFPELSNKEFIDKMFKSPENDKDRHIFTASRPQSFKLDPDADKNVHDLYRGTGALAQYYPPFTDTLAMLNDILPVDSRFTGSDRLIKNIHKSLSNDYKDWSRQRNINSGCLGDRI